MRSVALRVPRHSRSSLRRIISSRAEECKGCRFRVFRHGREGVRSRVDSGRSCLRFSRRRYGFQRRFRCASGNRSRRLPSISRWVRLVFPDTRHSQLCRPRVTHLSTMKPEVDVGTVLGRVDDRPGPSRILWKIRASTSWPRWKAAYVALELHNHTCFNSCLERSAKLVVGDKALGIGVCARNSVK